MTFFILRACIKISDTIVFEIPASASSSRSVSCWSLLIATLTYATFSGVVLVASLPGCGSLSTDSQPCLKHLCHIFICSALIALSTTSFWIIRIISKVECSSLKQNFDADSLLYSLSHFECNSHTVHMLIQQHLPPSLNTKVQSSLFMHAHSSPLSLAARLHWCQANHSH